MRRYSKAQLNAISRSYTEKAQKEALDFLKSQDIDFDVYCEENGWKASPVRLASKIRKELRNEKETN